MGQNEDTRFPWLILPQNQNEDDKQQLSYFDISQGRIDKLNLPPLLQGGLCCGSSKGWLVISMERVSPIKKIINCAYSILGMYRQLESSDMYLWSPISGVIKRLPSLSTLPSFDHFLVAHGYTTSSFVSKIELSSTDITCSECIIGGIFGGGLDLAFCRLGDERWSTYNAVNPKEHRLPCWCYQDILFYKDAFIVHRLRTYNIDNPEGRIYVHNNKEDRLLVDMPLQLDSIKLRDDDVSLKLITGIFYYAHDDPSFDPSPCTHLAESISGQVLVVLELSKLYFSRKGEIEHGKTAGFHVYELDVNTGQAQRVQDMGGQAVFVSTVGTSLCINSATAGGNCIYFAYNDKKYLYPWWWGFPCPHIHASLPNRESGLYYLDSQKIELCIPSFPMPMRSRVTWFTPPTFEKFKHD